MNLFIKKDFRSHSGLPLTWKLECDALGKGDWAAIAYVVAQNYKFTEVIGIPQGGLAFANALDKYAAPNEFGNILLVDDVLTTGRSMEEHKEQIQRANSGRVIRGVVLFSRAPNVPNWIEPVFTMNPFLTGIK